MTDNAIVQVDARRHVSAIRAESDMQLVQSWIDNLNSPITKKQFGRTVGVFLDCLSDRGLTLRTMTVEDMRECIADMLARSNVSAPSSEQQYVARVKALVTYGHKGGYLLFNAGTMIKTGKRNSRLAQRILTETQVALLVRAAPTPSHELLIEVGYFGALRVSEIARLTWADVIERDGGAVQINVMGKGQKERQALLPADLGRKLLEHRKDAPSTAPIFVSRNGGPLQPRGINHMLKRAARRAGLSAAVSAHWLRHAHASHALAKGATVADVKDFLGHDNIATTSAYLHARPDRSSAQVLDTGIIVKRGI